MGRFGTVTFQGLLQRPDGRPLHVRGTRCEGCCSGLDNVADGHPYTLAIRRGKYVAKPLRP